MNKRSIIIAITLVVLLFAIGFWTWEQKNRTTTMQQKTGFIKTQEKNEIDISNWKIYQDDNFGIKFQYPSEFSLIKKDNIVYLNKDCSRIEQESLEAKMRCDLEGKISFGTTYKSLKEFIKDYEADFISGKPLTRITYSQEYIIDNVAGTLLEGTTAEGINVNYIYVTKNDRNYIISFNQKFDINNKIIDTVKFIQ